jgi:hypothetical protein
MITSTIHLGDWDCGCIEEASCDLDVLKCRLMVYIGEDKIGEDVHDLTNRERIARHHISWFMRALGSNMMVEGNN